MTKRSTIAVSISIINVLFHLGNASAQEWVIDVDKIDKEDWVCEYCLDPKGWYGEVFAGFGHNDTDVDFYANVTSPILIDGYINYVSDSGSFFQIKTHDLGVGQGWLEMLATNGRGYKIALNYREIFADYAKLKSPFSKDLSLGSFVPAPDTKRMTLDQINIFDSQIKRDILSFDVAKYWLKEAWKTDLAYTVTNKKGRQDFSQAIGTNITYLPLPVDEQITEVKANISYMLTGGQMSIGYLGSFYENNLANNLQWDNPFSAIIGGVTQGSFATNFDNSSHYYTASGVYNFGKTRVHGQFSKGKSEIDSVSNYRAFSDQNDFAEIINFPSQLNQERDIKNVSFRLKNTTINEVTLRFSFDEHQRNNSSDPMFYRPVIFDFSLGSLIANDPYSFKREKTKFSASYKFNKELNLEAGVEQKTEQRTYQQRGEVQDDKYWLKARYRNWNSGDVVFEVSRLERDGENYTALAIGENSSLTQRFNLADRVQNRHKVLINIYPQSHWSATISLNESQSDYKNSLQGLLSSDLFNVDVSGNYQIHNNVNLSLYMAYQRYNSEIGVANWIGEYEDTVNSIGANMQIKGGKENPWTWHFDYYYSDANGSDVITIFSLQQNQFPDTDITIHTFDTSLDYQYSEKITLRLIAKYQRQSDSDWRWQGLDLNSIPNMLITGEQNLNYSGIFSGVSIGIKF